MTGASYVCRCGLSLEPPAGEKWWQPALDVDPGPSVRAVVRYGEPADQRRAVRRADGTGWSEYGSTVNYYHDITPPLSWSRVGDCWAENHHPVVAVREEGGRWIADV